MIVAGSGPANSTLDARSIAQTVGVSQFLRNETPHRGALPCRIIAGRGPANA